MTGRFFVRHSFVFGLVVSIGCGPRPATTAPAEGDPVVAASQHDDSPADPAVADPPGDGDPEKPEGFDNSQIDLAIRARFVDVRACYDVRVARAPQLEGLLFVIFEIDDGGRSTGIGFESETLSDAELEGCVAGVLGSIEFPRAPVGTSVSVRYPFDFRARSE